MKNTAILFIGYNRIDLIIKQIEFVRFLSREYQVYFSIDGPKNDQDKMEQEIILEKIQDLARNSKNIKLIYREFNLGMAKNIVDSIELVLKSNSAVVIIEDDVFMSVRSLEEICNLREWEDEEIAAFCFFSPIGFPILSGRRRKTSLRSSPYFSPWGWAVKASQWKKYQFDLSQIDIEKDLSCSKKWKKLSQNEKKIWLSRFYKVKRNPEFTWDYQFQFMCFKFDLNVILPILRMSENFGFNNLKSTNTKMEKPKWYIGNMIEPVHLKKEKVVFSKILIYIDRVTFAGIHSMKFRKLVKKISRCI